MWCHSIVCFQHTVWRVKLSTFYNYVKLCESLEAQRQLTLNLISLILTDLCTDSYICDVRTHIECV